MMKLVGSLLSRELLFIDRLVEANQSGFVSDNIGIIWITHRLIRVNLIPVICNFVCGFQSGEQRL